jgi:hypothetical protein
VVDGRKRVRRGVHRPMGEWDVLIKDRVLKPLGYGRCGQGDRTPVERDHGG